VGEKANPDRGGDREKGGQAWRSVGIDTGVSGNQVSKAHGAERESPGDEIANGTGGKKLGF